MVEAEFKPRQSGSRASFNHSMVPSYSTALCSQLNAFPPVIPTTRNMNIDFDSQKRFILQAVLGHGDLLTIDTQ